MTHAMCSATLHMRTIVVSHAPAPELLAPPLLQGRRWLTIISGYQTVPFGVHIHNLVFVFITESSRLV